MARWFTDEWFGAEHSRVTVLPAGFSDSRVSGSSGDLRSLFSNPVEKVVEFDDDDEAVIKRHDSNIASNPRADTAPDLKSGDSGGISSTINTSSCASSHHYGVLANFHHRKTAISDRTARTSGSEHHDEFMGALLSLSLLPGCPSKYNDSPLRSKTCVYFDRPRSSSEVWLTRKRLQWPSGGDEYLPSHGAGAEVDTDAVCGASNSKLPDSYNEGDSASGTADCKNTVSWGLGFEACPVDNASDAHRIWEALSVGIVPIVQASPTMTALKDSGLFPELLVLGAGGWSNASAIESLLSSQGAASVVARLRTPASRARNLLRLSVEWWSEAIHDQVEKLHADADKRDAVKTVDRPWGPQPPCQPPVI